MSMKAIDFSLPRLKEASSDEPEWEYLSASTRALFTL
jgi:hypothetical protein